MKTLHDEYVLWFVQNVYYAYSVAALVLLAFVLLALPAHRRSAQFLRWLTAIWLFGSICLYGAFQEAPALTWMLLGCLAFRVLVWISWRVFLPMAPPASRWVAWLTRLSLGANWSIRILREYLSIDPRAVYWFDLARSARGLPMERDAKDRANLLEITSRDTDRRSKTWRFLLVRLVETLIWFNQHLPGYWLRNHKALRLDEPVLESLLWEAANRTRQDFLYCLTDRDFEAFLHRTELEQRHCDAGAKANGRLHCHYRKALAEYATFRKPWERDDPGLRDAADWCYKTWLFRREFDHCWIEDAATATHLDDADSLALEELTLQETQEDPSETSEDGTDRGSTRDGSEGSSSQTGMSHDDVLLPRQKERLADLLQVSELLAACLGIDLPDNPLSDRSLLARADAVGPDQTALMLLMVACLRQDLALKMDPETLRAHHHRVLERVRNLLKSPARDQKGKQFQSRFLRMLIDYLVEQKMHLDLRGNFDQGLVSLEGDEHWKILGDAQIALAGQLKAGTPMSEKLLNEAIEAYFRARWRGIWTLAIARELVGVASTEELLAEFAKHPVEFSRAKLPAKSARTSPSAPESARTSRETRVQLTVYHSKRPGRRRSEILQRFPCVLGSSVQAQVVLGDKQVAEMHCTLDVIKGRLKLKTLSDQHCVLYQERQVHTLQLKPSDRFQVGPYIVEVKIL